jgi:hypothetical protein
MMMRAIRLLVLLAGVALAGCASVSGGNVQKMYVQAQSQNGAAVTGADCTLTNDKGTWRLTAPGDTSIVRSNKRMEVKCDKSPLPQGVVSVESATRGAMYGNIILGGVVGAVIDHNSGAAYEYPEMIKVIMGRMVSMDVPKQPVSGTRDPNIPRDTRAASARPASNLPPGQAIAAADPGPRRPPALRRSPPGMRASTTSTLFPTSATRGARSTGCGSRGRRPGRSRSAPTVTGSVPGA